jgi:4-alpha-glucanotransferase
LNNKTALLDSRRAGILLHITSIPVATGNGYLGQEAKQFIDFLASVKITVWQMLPLGPTHVNGSPYQTLSVHANNPRFIDLNWLESKGWLTKDRDQPSQALAENYHHTKLKQAYNSFCQVASDDEHLAFKTFKQAQQQWLDDYSLFMTLHEQFFGQEWQQWPIEYRDRHKKTIDLARLSLRDQIEQYCFEQFVFYLQWHELRDYGAQKGIVLLGDIPIFVASNSDAVWAHPQLFELADNGYPRVVAGVPPDYFSDTGQLWGNPLYCWDAMQEEDFKWWIGRLQSQLELFDCVRFDHFRALESYWEIPADAETAIHGNWIKAPGKELLTAFIDHFGSLPLIAEDLGIITSEVEALRDEFNLPGMKVLQFAFGGGADNIHLPHNHIPNCVVYTGTHDNDTSFGWYNSLDSNTKTHIDDYLASSEHDPAWRLIRCALSSTSQLAVIPMQDVLSLPSQDRMNTPGTIENNWQWQLDWDQLDEEHCSYLRQLVSLYGRAA